MYTNCMSNTIGVGVGALIFNDQGKILLAQRGPKARNEQGKWEIPGGKVEYGEKLEEAIVREVLEETGVVVRVKKLLKISDHILSAEKQHWVSPTYICEIVSGTPSIQEPEKSTQLGWFTLAEAKKLDLAEVTKQDIQFLETVS